MLYIGWGKDGHVDGCYMRSFECKKNSQRMIFVRFQLISCKPTLFQKLVSQSCSTFEGQATLSSLKTNFLVGWFAMCKVEMNKGCSLGSPTQLPIHLLAVVYLIGLLLLAYNMEKTSRTLAMQTKVYWLACFLIDVVSC